MKRRAAREIAVQALYQMEMNDVNAQTAILTAMEGAEEDGEPSVKSSSADSSYLSYVGELVEETYRNRSHIDVLLAEFLKGWKMDRLSRVDRQILRLAVYEMCYRDDVPPKVVINEAIELAKHFGTEESGKFINGVLGKMVHQLDDIKGNIQSHT